MHRPKSRVLHLINSFNVGGTERQCVQLVNSLRECSRYEVYLSCQSAAGPLIKEVRDSGRFCIPQYPLNSFYDRNAVIQLRRFVAFLKTNHITVVHTHDFYTNIFGMVAAALARVSVRIASRREMSLFNEKQRKVERLSFKLADAVIANSNMVRSQLMAEGLDPNIIHTVHNGVDLRRFPAEEKSAPGPLILRMKLPECSRRRFVTMVANMRHEFKDYPTFLRAARLVRGSIPEAFFILAGEGQKASELQALSFELGLADCTYFAGSCTDVPGLLALSDVCVLSSKSEGFSNVILEYMASSKPAVVTDVGGASEAIVNNANGFIVPPESAGDLADKIIMLLNYPSLARAIGAEARRTIERRFSAERQLNQITDLYDQLITRSHSSRVEISRTC